MADAMDSKSISREGVGVQVPASAPSAQLASELLPVLLHKLNNVTQVFSGLNSLLTVTKDASLLTERAGDLEYAGAQLHRLGWVVGMLGASQGADLLLARREAQALRWSLEALVELYGREGRRLVLPERLPRVAPAKDEPRVCWELLVWVRAHASARESRLLLEAGEQAWVFRVEGAAGELRLPREMLVELS